MVHMGAVLSKATLEGWGITIHFLGAGYTEHVFAVLKVYETKSRISEVFMFIQMQSSDESC